nr:DUF3048 domain-containing protein [Petropleomorpha daqingensis]
MPACGPDEQPRATGTSSSSTTAAPTTTTPPPPPPPPPVYPLTGVQAPGVVNRPALAVKIENSIDARPQTGLNMADMVWEEVVEGGITRYVAVYQSAVPAEIGPVRSVRPMDPAIAAPLHGLLAFSGGQQQYVDAVGAAGLQVLSMDAGSGGFYRVHSRRAPHNVYATPQTLLDQADGAHVASPPPQFTFAGPGQPPSAGAPAGVVRLTMSGVSHPSWTWSPPDGAWLRSEGPSPAVEADGARLRATNVVVLSVNVVNTSARDPAGNPVPETQLLGSGSALVAIGGTVVTATWSKASLGDPVVLTGPDGAVVRLAPGTTWVELVPLRTGSVTTG